MAGIITLKFQLCCIVCEELGTNVFHSTCAFQSPAIMYHSLPIVAMLFYDTGRNGWHVYEKGKIITISGKWLLVTVIEDTFSLGIDDKIVGDVIWSLDAAFQVWDEVKH